MDTDSNLCLLQSNRCSSLGINTCQPKYPRYVLRINREESFKTWPDHLPVNVSELVDSGLVYTGVGDAVRCYHCGGGLRNWERGDNPMFEHAKWYPNCPHVLLVKGQAYIDAVERGEDLAASERQTGPPEIKADIESAAAQACLEIGGCTVDEVKKAITTYKSKQGDDDFTARDLLQLILDEDEVQEGEPKVDAGASSHASNRAPHVNPASNAGDCISRATTKSEVKEIRQMAEENERIKEQQLCKICLDKQSCVVFLPCGHLVSCLQCAPALYKCPLCRLEIRGQVRAHFS